MREGIFDCLAGLVSKRPWVIVIVSLVVTVIAGGLSEGLRMETRVMDLLPKDEPAAQEFDDIVRQYASASQIMVGIEGKDKRQMIAFAEALGKRAKEATYTDKKSGEKRPYVKRITVRSDVGFIAEHGLMLAKERDLENIEEIFQDLDMASLLTAYNDFFEREYIEDQGSVTEREKEDRAIDSLKSLLTWLEGLEEVDKGAAALDARAEEVSDLLSVGNPYFFSEDDQMLLVLIMPNVAINDLDETMEGIQGLRDVSEDIQKDFRTLRVRMTGMPVLMLEETEVVLNDMGVSSIVSLLLVLALFIIAFRMWTAPLLAVINLVVGIVWAAGFVALTVGRLNLLTFMFAVILIGLGIDFAIHLNAAFSTARSRGRDLRDSLKEMYTTAGPGVITGALTTAAAFFALSFTGLDALVELGVVLGSGILLTLVASLILLPALYAIHFRTAAWIRKGRPAVAKPVRLAFPFLGALGGGIQRHPWPVLLGFLAISAGLGYMARRASFEPDMLEMEPPDMKSVLLHREILKKYELHPDYAMVTTDNIEETRRIIKKLKKNRLVGQAEGISEFVPSAREQKRRARVVKRIRGRMDEILSPRVTVGLPGGAGIMEPPWYEVKETASAAEGARLLEELGRFQKNVQEVGQLAFASMKLRLQRTCDRLTGGQDEAFSQILGLRDRLKRSSNLGLRIARYERAYVPRLAEKLRRMANPAPITMKSLPDNIRDRYMSAEGKNLVTIYSSVDLWQEGKTELFLKATRKAADRVTGTAVIVDRLIVLIGEKGLMATLLALGAIFVILIIDFRRIGFAVLGTLPLLAGFAWMVGLFVLLGKKFDVTNVCALPLILGIGIDDAVHVLHAIKRKGKDAIPEVMRHTGRALLLTSLTTGIAFGAIGLSAHRGMAGMGILLVLGVVSCFIASVTLLPALIRIFGRDKKSNEGPMDKEVENEKQ